MFNRGFDVSVFYNDLIDQPQVCIHRIDGSDDRNYIRPSLASIKRLSELIYDATRFKQEAELRPNRVALGWSAWRLQ